MKKRGERIARTKRVVAKRKRFIRTIFRQRTPGNLMDEMRPPTDMLAPKRVGRMRKHAPLDCGKPKCGTCHSERKGRPIPEEE